MMDREAEPRRDLAPTGGTYAMGGELFTITETKIVYTIFGPVPSKQTWVHVPFGRDK